MGSQLSLLNGMQSSTSSQMQNDINTKFNEFKNKIGIQIMPTFN
jgi:hypothetical protein